MKTEHRDIIERAKRLNLAPSDIAHELTVRDLVEAGLFEIKNIHAPWNKLNESSQQEVIDRLTKAAEESVWRAISIISARSVDTIPVTVVDAKFKAKAITVTAAIDAQDPNRHGLIDVAGKLCLLVLAPNDYAEALDSNQPDRDQAEFPLHVSELTGSLLNRSTELDEQPQKLGTAEELAERTSEVLSAFQGKEFGDYTYEDAAQLIVLKATTFDAAWLQSRLAIDSDQASTLLLRLVDNDVIQLETEADLSIDNTYKVIASLDDLDMNLSVE